MTVVTAPLQGQVALVTGAANGIGAAAAHRLAARGAHVVVADVDTARGAQVAEAVGGAYVRCDVSRLDDNVAAVRTAVDTFGGLDIVLLNAGVPGGVALADDPALDVDRYRHVVGVNLDSVVYGVHAALPALRARGGGRIVATASMAGLTAMPLDPVYAATKHAVIGLVRSLGPALAPEGIVVNALCPSFARTAIIDSISGWLDAAGVPVLDVDEVVDALLTVLASSSAGECWSVVPGRTVEPFRFRGAPGPRSPTGERAPAADVSEQVTGLAELSPSDGVAASDVRD